MKRAQYRLLQVKFFLFQMSFRHNKNKVTPISLTSHIPKNESVRKVQIYSKYFQIDAPVDQNPCIPSPCGPYSNCKVVNNQASCSCIENEYGSAPYCQPECTINSDCSSQEICMNHKCRRACSDDCGLNADCFVRNHIPVCVCKQGFNGNPYEKCVPEISKRIV